MDYTAYQQTGDGTWVGTHHLPLKTAVMYCKQFRLHTFGCPVAIVPDNADPQPIFGLVEKFEGVTPRVDETVDTMGVPYPRGRCDTCGAPCDFNTGECTEDHLHVVAFA